MHLADHDHPTRTWRLQRAALVGVALAMLLAAVLLLSLLWRHPAVFERVRPTSRPVADQVAASLAPGGQGTTGTGQATAADPAGAGGQGQTTVNPPVSEAPRPLPDGQAPDGWPASLPVPGDIAVLGGGPVADQEWRWVLTTSRDWPLAGGQLIEQLESAGWDLTLSSTASGVTLIGERGDERLSVVLRPGGPEVPPGWAILEVIYQSAPPEIRQAPPDTGTKDQAAEQGA